MANRKLIDSDYAISILEQYRAENPYKQFTVEEIARKAQTLGFPIKGRILRRDKKFMEAFNEDKKSLFEDDKEIKMIAYKPVNIREIFDKRKGIDYLIEFFTRREEYIKSVCISANKEISKCRELKSRIKKTENEKELLKENKVLRKYIERFVNPIIAQQILNNKIDENDINLPINMDSIIRVEPKTKITNKKLDNIMKEFDDEEEN